MSIGPVIRQMFGPLERPVSEMYRSIFVDLTAFVGQIQQWAPASNILELGCGEGAVIERLVKAFPKASVTGIDITPRVGRLFRGDSARVTFKQQTIQDFAPENLASFDMLVVADIMHHIPWEYHKEVLLAAATVLMPGGYLILKDWERRANLIHALCYFSDRYITGDHVRFKSAEELRALINVVFGANCIKAETRIRPQVNNIAFLVQI
jgi:2-polyprenyl-6-hydroxyphenyl methylase/3-demethylubiquinone-9 3-methyltransferase